MALVPLVLTSPPALCVTRSPGSEGPHFSWQEGSVLQILALNPSFAQRALGGCCLSPLHADAFPFIRGHVRAAGGGSVGFHGEPLLVGEGRRTMPLPDVGFTAAPGFVPKGEGALLNEFTIYI